MGTPLHGVPEWYFFVKSHLQSYPCPLQINFFWNLGFLLGVAIILQIITGILLALHYTSDISTAYFSVFFLIREVYYGWCLRYFHSSGASFVFLFLFLHLGRAIFVGSYFHNPNTWFSGIVLLLCSSSFPFCAIIGSCDCYFNFEQFFSFSIDTFLMSFWWRSSFIPTLALQDLVIISFLSSKDRQMSFWGATVITQFIFLPM